MSDFYKCVPKWIIRIIESRKCYHCDKLAQRIEIEAFGIRKVMNGNLSTFYVEHCCSNCNKRTITSFGRERQAAPVDLAYEIIEYEQNQRRLRKVKALENVKRTGDIEPEEIQQLLEFMNRTDTHEDFMRFIGAYNIETLPDEEDNEDEG